MKYKYDKLVLIANQCALYPKYNHILNLANTYANLHKSAVPVIHLTHYRPYKYITLDGSVLSELYPSTLYLSNKDIFSYFNPYIRYASHIPHTDMSDASAVFSLVKNVIYSNKDDDDLKSVFDPENKLLEDFKLLLYIYFSRMLFKASPLDETTEEKIDDIWNMLNEAYIIKLRSILTENTSVDLCTVVVDHMKNIHSRLLKYHVVDRPFIKGYFAWMITNIYHTVYHSIYTTCKQYTLSVSTQKDDLDSINRDIHTW